MLMLKKLLTPLTWAPWHSVEKPDHLLSILVYPPP